MKGLDECFLAGYIASDIYFDVTKKNEPAASFLLKVGSRNEEGGRSVKIRINCYDELAEYCRNFKKDDYVFLKGKHMVREIPFGDKTLFFVEVKAYFIVKREFVYKQIGG